MTPDLQNGAQVRYVAGPDLEAGPEQLAEKCQELAETLTVCSAFAIALLKRNGGSAKIAECEIASQAGERLAWQRNGKEIGVFVLGGVGGQA